MSARAEPGRPPARRTTEAGWYERPRQPQGQAGPQVVARPEYLSDFNYYRLAYQSAADRLNCLIKGANDARAAQARVEEPAPDAAPRVKRLTDDVDATLAALDQQRVRTGRFRRLRPPTAYDRKLQTFLERTVRPSARLLQAQLGLLIAESKLTADPDAARAALKGTADLETSLARNPDSSASHRVLYNLACVTAQRTRLTRQLDASEASYEDALNYLKQAVAVSTADQRAHLQNWAMKDPSLEPVRRADDAKFREALDLKSKAG
jgi:hypothetical protein